MSEEDHKKVIGYRQSIVLINESKVRKAYLAQDIEENMKNELVCLLRDKGIEYEFVPSKKELGKSHGIKVSASIVCLLN